jgi:beta-barrel assembly-enhancing protease
MPTGRRSTTRPIGNIIGNISVSGLPLLLWILLGATHGYARVEITPCKNNFSPEQQVELGQKAAQQVYAEMPVLPDSNAVTKYVQKLGQKLAAQAPGHKWPYNFHVANVAEINAFALPGGTVFVNLGTIQAAANEAQLAGVMAHEIAHVVLQHSVCNAAKQQKVGLIAGIGQIAAGVLLGGAAGQIAQQGIGMTAGLSFLKMSRGAEKEADLLGVGILYDAGYDPRAMPQFFETLQGKYGEGSAQFLSDHPNPGNRSEYVDKEIATFAPRGKYITKTPAFTKIKQTVAGMHAYTAREVSSGVWKKQTPNQTVGAGVNQPAGSANVDLNIPADWSVFRGSGFSIDAALNALISGIARDNPGLSPGPAKKFTAGGIVGRSIECDNPSANNGKGERDWIIAFPQNGGILRYFVFVAPSSDFNKLRSVYTRMAQSIVLQ